MPTDEVTLDAIAAVKRDLTPDQWLAVCEYIFMEREQAEPFFDFAEQRGYDRAIAEVVAMLDRRVAEANATGDYDEYCAADGLTEAKRAIEAGEHKP